MLVLKFGLLSPEMEVTICICALVIIKTMVGMYHVISISVCSQFFNLNEISKIKTSKPQ